MCLKKRIFNWKHTQEKEQELPNIFHLPYKGVEQSAPDWSTNSAGAHTCTQVLYSFSLLSPSSLLPPAVLVRLCLSFLFPSLSFFFALCISKPLWESVSLCVRECAWSCQELKAAFFFLLWNKLQGALFLDHIKFPQSTQACAPVCTHTHTKCINTKDDNMNGEQKPNIKKKKMSKGKKLYGISF